MARLIDEDILIGSIPDLNTFEEEDFCTSDMVHLIEDTPTVEAIPKADYENRLKADLVAMLEELALKLYEQYDDTDLIKVKYIRQAIQQKINSLKGGKGNYNT